MGWGILEPRGGGIPMGTVRLGEKQDDEEDLTGVPQDALKKQGNVVLQPQPGDDPNDPLNWSKKWKIAHFFVIAFGSALTNGLSTMVTPGIAPMVEKFKVSEASISSLIITAPTFWTSLAGFFVVSAADVWGRRPLYIPSIAFLALTNYGAYLSETYPSLVAFRTLAGFSAAPLFSLGTASLADIFFVHERGTYIALATLALNAGGQIAQIVSGFVIDAMGVSASFGFVAIVYAALFPAAYMVLLESAYFKPRVSAATRSRRDSKSSDQYTVSGKEDAEMPPKRTYGQNLALFRGRVSDMSFWVGAAKPLGMLSSPIIIYSTFLSTVLIFLLVGAPTLLTIILAKPPYNLTPSQIGLTNLPLFAVATVGGPIMGWASDAMTRYMARTNTNPGVAEPEFRLVMLAFTVPLAAVGLIGLALAAQDQASLPILLVWNSVVNLGTIGTTQLSITYVVDCYPKQSAQAFISINGIAALISFVGTAPVTDWLGTSGPVPVLGTLAAAGVAVALMAIPMYVWGKRMRSWYSRAAWAQKFITQ